MTKGHFRPVLFVVIVSMHFLAAYAVWFGFTHHGFSLAAWAWFIALYTLRTVGVSLGNHRLFTHGAYKCHLLTKVILAFLSGLAAEGPIKKWVADHEQHHYDTEGPWDPHSPGKYPGFKGFLWSHIGWIFFEVKRPPKLDFEAMAARQNADVIPWDAWAHPLGVFTGVAAPYYFLGTEGFLFPGVNGIVTHWNVTWSVNSICHIFGYTDERFRKKKDTSKNNFLLAIPTYIGEALHFNHHAKADSAYLGWKWYDPDLGKWILLAGEPLGIFWNIKKPPIGA
jgi:stearoyl-CoA desaturase (delta-9 desaturase)